MTEREPQGEGPEPAPEVRRALDRLGAPPARAAFADRLRRDFVAGRLAERPGAPGPRARRWIPWAIAAGILLLVLPLVWRTGEAEPTWTVIDAAPAGSLRIDGRLVAFAEDAALAAALAGAQRIETPGARVRLRLRDQLVVELAADSSLRVRNARTEVLGSPAPLQLELERGSLAAVTSAGFAGSRLEVVTDQAAVEVTGTAFSVDLVPGMGTCVCCLEGSLEVRSRLGEQPSAAVRAGGNAFVFRDGRLESGEPVPEHVAPVEGLLPLR